MIRNAVRMLCALAAVATTVLALQTGQGAALAGRYPDLCGTPTTPDCPIHIA